MSFQKYRRIVSRVVRLSAGLSGSPYPIRVVDGTRGPSLEGDGGHHETRGGRRISYPTAYARRGWSNMVYVPSSRRIEVGAAWLIAALLATV